uniref:nuclear speckle splicing regulatory protein 1-like n=1 Tax=Erigeron canadensis TaxID=72917 RepID=UPI001CB9A3F2|nr:nuclear speckle splicing regulatory protein 1-like [Erigeron canadensis]
MKYGLNLRGPSSQQKKQPVKLPRPSALGFGDDDDDDVEREISRQAGKNKALKDVEEQHKKALEEDPSVFDYDGVYDEMKEKAVRPVAQDRQERKPRYIQALIDKAKEREREHEIIYERKLVKERTKDDHLFGDKDKFVTSAYKRKLAEQAKWLEEERLRQLREEKEDVTKKGGDMTDFYFSLSKNVAFGAPDGESTKPNKHREESKIHKPEGNVPSKMESTSAPEINQGETSAASMEKSDIVEAKPIPDTRKQEVSNDPPKQESGTGGVVAQSPTDHHKRNQDALAAAKERFLARKKTKVVG